ncbi:MAG: bifunctional phosphoribosylaminoimidazolecarboxamide formyltransferase/IMP cyclohydrolase [Candidatus Promineifilaceae bacterium]|nr:bifunctional phosphoribosylaminoimidazolecarboxamide formyltransferase/IMP cyclohydrolase [Candidatus Promineifilaceae bacterium]
MTRRAILSVHDKTGLVDFARALAEMGWELVASGGTARALRQAGLEAIDVSEITGAPEILGGRVKTLHPAVHGAILARDTDADRQELEAQDILPVDLVVCNLYPFEEAAARRGVTLDEAIEQIDVGGVAMLRAAAKNMGRVTVVCDPEEYEAVLEELRARGEVGEATRRRLGAAAFGRTRDYDTAISAYLESVAGEDIGREGAPAQRTLPARFSLNLQKAQTLRYGENPHQAAALYAPEPEAGPLGGQLVQGKPLSYNNLLDLDAAWSAALSFDQPSVVIVKHLSPCGVATHPLLPAHALPAAIASDPISAFGSVIAANRPVEKRFVEALDEAALFVEAVVAPDFSEDARSWFAAHKKNCRLLALPDVDLADDAGIKRIAVRAIRGGYLVQETDLGEPEGGQWEVVTEREPTAEEWESLHFAWKVVPHVRSNAIVIAQQTATVGIGGGMPSRVDAVRLAVTKSAGRASGAALASDAFFPFPDGVEVAAEAGVATIIQPGGSIRDQEVIDAADELGLAMVFTGVRHFRH